MKYSTALLALLLTLLWSCAQDKPGTAEPLPDDGTSKYWNPEQKPFYHGLASGDPLADRVILWTRVTPETMDTVAVKWRVATGQDMKNIVQSGETSTGPERDFTVKVDAKGLSPDTYYYFQFEALGASSPVGRTRTAPAGPAERLQFAVVSCSNFEAGYFNAFDRIAGLDSLSAVLHLGDYIYEYGPGRYGDTTTGRFHLPPKEIVELSDYRTRYSQYRLDEDFQRVHRMHPFITIWDDHEIANNSYQTGAQNHQPEEEGDYQARKSAARQAYYEWLPVREGADAQLYRHIAYGNLASLIMLDERLVGRSPQADSISQPDYASEERSMLGKKQLEWFREQLATTDATWKVIGNQVIFSNLDQSARRPNRPRNLDAWDGYPAEQQHIINFIKENNIENVIFVTGDTHSSWAFEVPESIAAYKADPTSTVAVEFGTTSISSANLDESLPRDTVLQIEKELMAPEYNPHLKYANLRDHGYLLLTLTPEEAIAEWRFVESVLEKTEKERTEKVVRVKKGDGELR